MASALAEEGTVRKDETTGAVATNIVRLHRRTSWVDTIRPNDDTDFEKRQK